MPGQFKRPPSANRGREDAERKVHREVARADLLAKRVEQTMQKVIFCCRSFVQHCLGSSLAIEQTLRVQSLLAESLV